MSAGPQEKALDKLLAYAEEYAEFGMRQLGRVPPSLLAISPRAPFTSYLPTSRTFEQRTILPIPPG